MDKQTWQLDSIMHVLLCMLHGLVKWFSDGSSYSIQNRRPHVNEMKNKRNLYTLGY
jgi:hypothetical protein